MTLYDLPWHQNACTGRVRFDRDSHNEFETVTNSYSGERCRNRAPFYMPICLLHCPPVIVTGCVALAQTAVEFHAASVCCIAVSCQILANSSAYWRFALLTVAYSHEMSTRWSLLSDFLEMFRLRLLQTAPLSAVAASVASTLCE